MYLDGVVFGLLDTSDRIPGTRLAEKFRNFTIAWSRYGYHDVILENDSVDALLQEALDLGYRYCLIQAYGHIIGETWIPEHWEQVDFHTALGRWIDNHDFFIAGTIQQNSNGGFGLDDNCLLVNLHYYAAMEQPLFGCPHTQPAEVIKPSVTMDADIDSGRFCLIEYTEQTVCVAPQLAGWNLIDASLRNKLAVYNFDKSIDGNRILLFDSDQQTMKAFSEHLDTELNHYSRFNTHTELSRDQKQFLDSIDSQVRESRKGVFLFNLEPYTDVLEIPDHFTPPLTSLYCVAAGFKANMILHSLGFDNATRMVFFDYSEIALEIRKFIVAEWDGVDFPAFVRMLMTKFPPDDVFYQLWADLAADEIAWGDLEQLWLNEIKKWGGAEVFRQHWETYRKLPHEYIHCNLLNNNDSLLAAIRNQPNAAIWWSNAFFTVYSNWLHTADERKILYDNWLLKLADRNPSIFLYGSDYNNINVNHIRIGDYLEQYQSEGGNYLKPCKLYKHEMRL